MPDDALLLGSPSDRAARRASLAAANERSRELTETFQEQRAHFAMSAESLAVERRILNDDYRHWDERSA